MGAQLSLPWREQLSKAVLSINCKLPWKLGGWAKFRVIVSEAKWKNFDQRNQQRHRPIRWALNIGLICSLVGGLRDTLCFFSFCVHYFCHNLVKAFNHTGRLQHPVPELGTMHRRKTFRNSILVGCCFACSSMCGCAFDDAQTKLLPHEKCLPTYV